MGACRHHTGSVGAHTKPRHTKNHLKVEKTSK